jgi:two-component system, OmpR family, heavy metal sensor histidine kinase CusS
MTLPPGESITQWRAGSNGGHAWIRTSLAARLVLLFSLGTTVLLLVLGMGLSWTLRSQLEERDREELDGKTQVVEHLLRELSSGVNIEQRVGRLREVGIGHPHLQIGLREGNRWLVSPSEGITTLVGPAGNDDIPHTPRFGTFRVADESWWLRRVDYVATDGRTFAAYVGVHVSPTQELIQHLLRLLAGAGVAGVAASTALGWLITRRALAPLRIAEREAERVTAARLGQPLNVTDAPEEVRGLLVSINRMLARLQQSFRALEEFSADIAHELRTPLNNLMLQTQITLSRERSAAEYQEALHSNLQEVEQLQRMVSDMLFLARADRGMVQIRREDVDLEEETRSVTEYFDLAASENDQRIALSGSARTSGDRSMIRRALTNLLSNAVRYAPHGTLIRVELSTSSRGEATVDIANPSPTLQADEVNRLFARFARGREADSRVPQVDGVGLGLSIVESIMRLHGGTVHAETSPGMVRFRLTFPPST